MAKTALIIVDVQHDFLPGGSLGVPDGDQIIEPLIEFGKKVDQVVFTRDWHPSNHVSFSDNPEFVDKSWPSHCVQHTNGAFIDRRLRDAFPQAAVFSKGDNPDVEEYSGWNARLPDGLKLSEFFFTDENEVESLYVAGLALDYCVNNTAVDAWFNIGGGETEVIVLTDLTRPVAYQTGIDAAISMSYNGILLVPSTSAI